MKDLSRGLAHLQRESCQRTRPFNGRVVNGPVLQRESCQRACPSTRELSTLLAHLRRESCQQVWSFNGRAVNRKSSVGDVAGSALRRLRYRRLRPSRPSCEPTLKTGIPLESATLMAIAEPPAIMPDGVHARTRSTSLRAHGGPITCQTSRSRHSLAPDSRRPGAGCRRSTYAAASASWLYMMPS